MAGTRGRGGGRGKTSRNATAPTSEQQTTHMLTLMPNLNTETTPNSQTPVESNTATESLTSTEAGEDGENQVTSVALRGRKRGRYLSKNIPTNEGERKVIRFHGSNYLDTEVPRRITKDYKGSFRGKDTNWSSLDKTLVEHLYKKFLDLYKYEDHVDPKVAREVWEEKTQTLSRQTWSEVRKKCKKKSQSSNPVDWKPHRPPFVHEEDWDGILESWMTPKWKKLSENGAKNRKSVPGGDEGASSYVRHTGGSINFSIHLERLEKEIGREPTQLEGFTRIHKKQKGKGDWCDVRAEKAVKRYEEMMLEKHPHDVIEQSSEIPFDSHAWLEVTTISKKKQQYGFPKSQEAKKNVTSPSCSVQSQPVTLTSLEIEEHIEKEVAKKMDAKEARLLADMEEKMKAEMDAKESMMEEKMKAEMDAKEAMMEEKMKAEMDAKEARLLAEMRQMFETTRKP